jgi:DNA-binding transcriptional LysR family regulator
MEWSDLRIFLQVARAGQMAGASKALGLDQSTTSRRIARLEEQTGVSLFERAGRRLTITQQGAKLLEAATRLESIIIRDVMSLADAQREIGGRVRIGTSEGFGAHYLAQRLPIIMEDYPELEIELVALPRNYSLGMREVDLAITMDRPETGDVRYKKLTSYSLGLYAEQGYFDQRARPQSIDDVASETWCGYIKDLLFTSELDLMTFESRAITPRFRTTSVTVQLQAVMAGACLSILPCYLASDHIGLERILPSSINLQRTYWIAVHSDLAESPRVRLLMQQIEQAVTRDRALFSPGASKAPSFADAFLEEAFSSTDAAVLQPA